MANREVISAKLPTTYGDFIIHSIDDDKDSEDHVALVMGDVAINEPVLVRIHSECLTGDAFFSLRCDCGPQLQAAMEAIAKEGRGVLVYLRQEGRGIGLVNKIRAYALQDKGLDTVEANENLGFAADQRDFGIAARALQKLGIKAVKLMTNNPRKVDTLNRAGLNVVERVPLQIGRNPHNEKYLSTKHGKLGHLLDD